MPHDDDYSVADGSDGDSSKSSNKNSSKQKRLNVPYSNATPLFKAIEGQKWESVLMFLNTSKWSNSFLVSTTDHLKSPAPHIQCQTWVTEYNYSTRQPEWSQLPIHAAISYAAPAVVIHKLIDLYPPSLKERDNEGMLPVHLAFGFALPDTVLSLLLKAYPESAQERGPGGRLPHQCCDLGPNKVRGEVFGMIAEQTSDLARTDQELQFKNHVLALHKLFEIDDTSLLDNKNLKDLISDLVEDRKQLLDLKLKMKKYSEATVDVETPRKSKSRNLPEEKRKLNRQLH